MMYIKNKIIYRTFFAILFSHGMYGATIGSDSAVTRFDTQQALGNGDRVAGFAWLDAGFTLTSAVVTATWDSFFEVAGDIALNQGTLVLNQDLILHNVSGISTLGNITGNHHVLELSSSVTCLPSGGSGPTPSGDCGTALVTSTVEGFTVQSVDWTFDGNFVADGFSGNTPQKVKVYSFDGTTLTFRNAAVLANTTIESVRWSPNDYLLAIVRRTTAAGGGDTGEELLVYRFDPILFTFTRVSGAEIGFDAVSVSWHPSGNYLAIGTLDASADVIVYAVSGGGTVLTPVVTLDYLPDRSMQVQAMAWDPTGNYLAFGVNKGKGPELLVYQFVTTPTPALIPNASATENDTVFSIDWCKTDTNIMAIGYENQPLRVFQHNGGAGTLTNLFSQSVGATQIYSVAWNPNCTCLAVGQEVSSGPEFAVFTVNYTAGLPSSLTLKSGFSFNQEFLDVRWSPNSSFIATGGDTDILYIYGNNSGASSGSSSSITGTGICFNFSNLEVELDCDMCLANCIKFQGQSILNGRGYTLTLQPFGMIEVDTNSTLLIQNIIIKNIAGSNILPLSNSSTFSFENVLWIQDGDYTFTEGHFDVLRDWHVVGDGFNFNYQSTQPSTIQQYGRMILDHGVAFSYNPANASPNLLQLTNNTSQLILQGATFNANTTGINLLTGQLLVDNDSLISVVAPGTINFGDGSNSANNLTVRWFPAATLEAVQGCVVYKDA